MAEELLVYGSYGYAGSLVTRTAVERGLEPVLAGRRAERVEEQATALDLDHRVFSLEHPEIVAENVADVDAVLNCAGPFARTAEPMSSACIATGTDYLDLAGEVHVLEEMAGRDYEATEADVTLLPAVGFDVVPTDCLAAYLEARLPSATSLTLAMDGFASFSPGTLKSIVEGLGRPGAARVDGEVRDVPVAWKTREVDFGEGPKPAVSVPWGDVSTAYYTTRIPNIETYASVPPLAIEAMQRSRLFVPLLRSWPVRRALTTAIDVAVSGPTATERAGRVTTVLGEVENDDGDRAAALLRTPDTYDVAAETSVEAARRVLAGEVNEGFQTPASAFGTDFVLSFEGVEREDVAVPAESEPAGDGDGEE